MGAELDYRELTLKGLHLSCKLRSGHIGPTNADFNKEKYNSNERFEVFNVTTVDIGGHNGGPR